MFLIIFSALFFSGASGACVCLSEGGVYCSALSSNLERQIWETKCGVVKVYLTKFNFQLISPKKKKSCLGGGFGAAA
jgi:hypothetical protein